MSREIRGTDFKFTVDTSHGLNKDGFIAIGTESIVYKGLKTASEGGLQFSCVLKFKPKFVRSGDEIVDRLKKFKDEELTIFDDLQECRSIVRIFDVIEDLGDFSMPCEHVAGKVINSDGYFCVVEEYIDGWSLEEYCREESWKLRKAEQLENGLSRVINYHDYPEEERQRIDLSYRNYENIIKYQGEIIQFMINLCEILEFVTEKKNILHLDIKPENVMVTKYGRELVLIDFGRAKRITKADRFARAEMAPADYKGRETIDRMFQYGTLGYAAPECYAEAAEGSEFPFKQPLEKGKMSIESDIFSFGATFWECLNIFELVTGNKWFSEDSHDFYKEHFLRDEAYCGRDLSLTSIHYHKKLENIIRICTKARTAHYLEEDNREFYHSYSELKKDIEDARNSAPTIVRAENIKVRNAFGMFGVTMAVATAFLLMISLYRLVGYRVAMDKWNSLVSGYNVTRFYKLDTLSMDLIKTSSGSRQENTYRMISEFTYQDGDIDDKEAAMLVKLLKKMSSTEHLGENIDELMMHGNQKNFREISYEIMTIETETDSDGYRIARAIYNAEVGRTGYTEAFEVLDSYKDDGRFRNAVIKLRNVLDNDETIRLLAEYKGTERAEIQQYLAEIGG